MPLAFHPLALVQVNSPSLMRAGSVEQYKRAFARQRARDLAHHADALLSKDKEIAALQQECRELEARLGTAKVRSTTGSWSYSTSRLPR